MKKRLKPVSFKNLFPFAAIIANFVAYKDFAFKKREKWGGKTPEKKQNKRNSPQTALWPSWEKCLETPYLTKTAFTIPLWPGRDVTFALPASVSIIAPNVSRFSRA